MSGGSYKDVNTEGAREWLSMVKGMIDDGVLSRDVLSLGQWDSTGVFNSGNAAMAISGPWEIDRMVDDAKFDWGVTLLPTFKEGDPRSSALGGFNLGIPRRPSILKKPSRPLSTSSARTTACSPSSATCRRVAMSNCR